MDKSTFGKKTRGRDLGGRDLNPSYRAFRASYTKHSCINYFSGITIRMCEVPNVLREAKVATRLT